MIKRAVENSEFATTGGKQPERISADNAAAVYRMYDRYTPDTASIFALVGARSGEGTTYCTMRIAESIHYLLGDLSLLLVDANLSHSDLSEQVHSPEKGWIHWLGDPDRYSIREAVVPWRDQPGISVLPTGASPNSEGMRRVMRLFDAVSKLKANFDFILIDCPPFFSDRLTRLFCAGLGSVIVIVEVEKTRKSLAKNMVAELRSTDSDILGVILNKRRHHIPRWIYDRLF